MNASASSSRRASGWDNITPSPSKPIRNEAGTARRGLSCQLKSDLVRPFLLGWLCGGKTIWLAITDLAISRWLYLNELNYKWQPFSFE